MKGNIVVHQEKGTREKCTRIIQEVIVARDKVCQHPECNVSADCGHHLFKRDRLATAFLPEALLGVCVQHHTGWAHNKPKDFKTFMIKRLGADEYYKLRRLSYTTVKNPNYDEIHQELVRILRAYRRGA